ncbi:MAG: hypothetical protein GKR87_15430 [Kiritimatiellae bacterium]|nr:hypothetical protein [Kiritimatiellia bacterium]
MIWIDSDKENSTRLLSDYLTAELSDVGSCSSSREHIQELGHVVAHYVAKHFSATAIPQDYWTCLVSRSLWCIGEEDLARTYLSSYCSLERQRELSLFVFSDPERGAPLWEILTTPVMRSSNWVSHSSLNSWMIDVGLLSPEGRGCLDLVLYQGMHKLIRVMAPIWDKTKGKGVLGLKGLFETYKGACAKTKDRKHRAQEMVVYCEKIFVHLARCRNWIFTPSIFIVDFNH